jgi:hypothetical protein
MLKQIVFGFLSLAIFAASLTAQEQRKSPHETISATLGGHKISISYGRPYLKGRKAVGGSLVPYGEVWRTGADEATKLTTDADLTIGDLHVPKGTYALFTLPSKEGWTLIVSKKADQWGAFDYKQPEDLGRTPLAVKKISSPVEEFTMGLEPKSNDSVLLTLKWENTEASTTVGLAK